MADDDQKPVETALETLVVAAEVPAESAPVVLAVTEAPAAAETAVAEPSAVTAPDSPAPKKAGRPRKAAATPAAKIEIADPAPAPATAQVSAKPVLASRKAKLVKAPAPAREVKPATARVAKKSATRTPGAAKVAPQSKSAPRKTFTAPKISAAPALNKPKPLPASLKDMTMAKTAPIDFIASFQSFFSEFQTKAKDAYEKSTGTLGEANEFAKGNVEAVVESGKILASGLQEMSASLVTESRSAFETLTAEVKDLAAVKSPTEFFNLQSTLARKHFDAAIAQASKNTEAMVKLANEVVSPLSSRVTLAVEKVSKAA